LSYFLRGFYGRIRLLENFPASEAAINGRTLREGHPEFARPGLKKLKEKNGEHLGQCWPAGWSSEPVLPEQYRNK
jgi:hydroxymethylglutaryl-CoA lyase